MEIRTIATDLGKTVFHLACVNARGEVVIRKKCSRTAVAALHLELPVRRSTDRNPIHPATSSAIVAPPVASSPVLESTWETAT